MHRLVRRSCEAFLRATYGDAFWRDVAEAAGIDARGFSPAVRPGENPSHVLMREAAQRLGKPEHDLLEDLGAWLARLEPVRRLLRFSGRDFREFLQNLVELPDHAHMVIPDLGLPDMTVTHEGSESIRVILPRKRSEWSFALAGIIRAMADDYGVLGLIWVEDNAIHVLISDCAFSAARDFRLGGEDAHRETEAG
ncbi:heme NO-binding domain-containing protein [Paracoccus sp. (in: a-proteobacteria)]|uniref:heme NO-binding domain-containing protein n=1 Tax=Paracoccus sp. TaxID=267 RepID=UPI003A87AB96